MKAPAIDAHDPQPTPDVKPAADASPSPTSAPAFPATIAIGATVGTFEAGFGISIAGSAAAPLGEVALADDVGTLGIDGSARASFVYTTVPFAPYTLYDGFAVGSASWDAFFLYCQDDGSGSADVQLPYIYDEGISGAPMFEVSATGACNTTATTTAAVSLPALAIPAPTGITGYTVTGPDIAIGSDGTGGIVVDGKALPLIVFDTVDCLDCDSTGGWSELHSVIWDGAQERVVFVIVYLITGYSDEVETDYTMSLPDLGTPLDCATQTAAWTIPSTDDVRTRRVRPGMPHGVPPRARGAFVGHRL
jgi:hypothetical protein